MPPAKVCDFPRSAIRVKHEKMTQNNYFNNTLEFNLHLAKEQIRNDEIKCLELQRSFTGGGVSIKYNKI